MISSWHSVTHHFPLILNDYNELYQITCSYSISAQPEQSVDNSNHHSSNRQKTTELCRWNREEFTQSFLQPYSLLDTILLTLDYTETLPDSTIYFFFFLCALFVFVGVSGSTCQLAFSTFFVL